MKNIVTTLSLLVSVSSFAAEKLSLNVALSPAGSFTATTDKIKGKVIKNKDGSVSAKELSVNVKNIRTGIDLRDEHFHKHLNVKAHPKAILSDIQGKDGKATGTLEVAGVKRPIDIIYSEEAGHIKANFTVRASDYKLPSAQYMGVGVSDGISGEVNLPFKSL